MTRINQYYHDGSLATSLLTERVTFNADNRNNFPRADLGWTYIDVPGPEGYLITPFEGRLELSYESAQGHCVTE